MRTDYQRYTYKIEIEIVFEQVEAFDDVLVLDERHDHDLRRDPTEHLVVPPGMFGHLVLYDELDGDFALFKAVPCRHDEAIPSSAEFVP